MPDVSAIKDWAQSDPWFTSLPPDEQRATLNNYFDSELADDWYKGLDPDTQTQTKENFFNYMGVSQPIEEESTQYHVKGAAKQAGLEFARFPSDVLEGVGKLWMKAEENAPKDKRFYDQSMQERFARKEQGKGFDAQVFREDETAKRQAKAQALINFGKTGTDFYDELAEQDVDIKDFREAASKGDESIFTQALGAAGNLGGAVGMSMVPGVGPVLAGSGFFNLNKDEAKNMALQKLQEAGVDPQTAEKRAEDVSWTAGTVNSLLDTIGAGRIAHVFKPAKKLMNFFVGGLITSQIEGGTELTQGVVSQIAADWAAKPEGETQKEFIEKATERLPEYVKNAKTDYMVGSLLGGGGHVFGAGMGTMFDDQPPVTDDPVINDALKKGAEAAIQQDPITKQYKAYLDSGEATVGQLKALRAKIGDEHPVAKDIDSILPQMEADVPSQAEAGTVEIPGTFGPVEEVEPIAPPESEVQYDRQEEERLARPEREGEEPRGAVPEPGEGEEAVEAGRVLQKPPEDRGEAVEGEKVPKMGTEVETKGQVHDYSSTQVNLPESEAKPIRDFAAKIPDSEIYEDPKDPSYGREDEPHITVKYGLDTVNPKDVEPLLKDQGPIKAKMGKVSIFESDDYDVVKVDIDSPELKALNKKIADNLKVTDTHPTYRPHATIAYVKKGDGEKYVGDKSFEGKEVTFDSLTFSGKDGNLTEIPLEGQPTPQPKAEPPKKVPKMGTKASAVPPPGLFKQTPKSQRVSVDQLVPREPMPEGHPKRKAARELMQAALEGRGEPREPITVIDRGDGAYKVLDGNTTLYELQSMGIPTAEVEVKRTVKQQGVKNIEDLDSLYNQAREAQPEFKTMVDDWASQLNGEPVYSPPEYSDPDGLKKQKRAKEKAQNEYGSRVNELRDIVRGTIAFEDEEAMRSAAKALLDKDHRVLRIKDRYTKPTPSGYRDMAALVRLSNGHVAELQLNTKKMLEAKEEIGHFIYRITRYLDEQKDLSSEEQAVRDELTAVSKDFYNLVDQAASYSASTASASFRDTSEKLNSALAKLTDVGRRLPPRITNMVRELESKTKGTSSKERKYRSEDIIPPPSTKKIQPEKAKVKKKIPESTPDTLPGRMAVVPTESLSVDPDRFQYKRGMGEGGAGANLRKIKRFDPDLGGVIHVWRDPEDGKTYVVNGHHRYELAKRTGYPELTVRYLQADDAKGARAKGALINIAEGQGSPEDAANIFRDLNITPENIEKDYHISLKGAVASQGVALANLEMGLFKRVERGDFPRNWGVVIGENLPDETSQRELVKFLEKAQKRGKKINAGFIEQVIKELKGAGKKSETQENLFGAEAFERPLLRERSTLRDYVSTRLAQDKRLFSVVANAAKVRRLEEEGNVIDVDKNLDIAQKTAIIQEVFDKLVSYDGPVNDTLNRYAQELSDAKGKSEESDIKQRLFAELQEIIPPLIKGGKSVISEGTRRYSPVQLQEIYEGAQRGVREQLGLFGAPEEAPVLTPEKETPYEKAARLEREGSVKREKAPRKKAVVPDEGIKKEGVVGRQRKLFDYEPQDQIEIEFDEETTGQAPTGPGKPTLQAKRRSRMVNTGGDIQSEGFVLRDAADAAALFPHLKDASQENAYFVNVDKDGNILEIHRYGKGTKSAAAVALQESIGRAMKVPGTKKVYFVHNHPSASGEGSIEDKHLIKRLRNALKWKDKDIELEGIVIAGNQYLTFNQYRSHAPQDIKSTIPKVKIPAKERAFVEDEPLKKVENADQARQVIAEEYDNQDGFMFLDGNLRVVGFLPIQGPMKAQEMATEIIEAGEETNATGVVLHSTKTLSGEYNARYEFVKDMQDILHGSGYQFVEILTPTKSFANARMVPKPLETERAYDLAAANLEENYTVYSRTKTEEKPTGVSPLALNHLARKLKPVFKGYDGDIVVLPSAKNLGPKALKAANVDPNTQLVRGLHQVQPDGKRTIYLFADGMSNKKEAVDVFLEEMFHDGVSMALGEKAKPVLNSIYNRHEADIKRVLGEDYGYLDTSTPEGRQAAADEWIAKGLVNDTLPKEVWRRIVTAIRNMLRKAGIKVDLNANEVREMAKRAVVEGRQTGKPSLSTRLQTVFHGTPHIWPPEPGFPHGRPRLDKIGTGEGGAAYGWGFYLADAEEVSQSYAYKIPPDKFRGKDIGTLLDSLGRKLDRLPIKSKEYRELQERYQIIESIGSGLPATSIRWNYDTDEYLPKTRKLARSIKDTETSTESLYTLDIPEDVLPKLLDWDNNLSQDTADKIRKQALKEGLSQNILDFVPEKPGPEGHTNGHTIYHLLSKEFGEKQNQAAKESGGVYSLRTGITYSPKAASEFLARAGIPGNKYYDQMSRIQPPWQNSKTGLWEVGGVGTGTKQFYTEAEANQYFDRLKEKQTRNYVIWNQDVLDRIALLERNGEKLDAIREADPNQFAQSRMSLKQAVKKITDNPAFKKWFGESKVVDENGEPLVVYHSTAEDFSKFKPVGKSEGFFFAPHTAVDMGYDKPGWNTMPVYLSLQNPKYLSTDTIVGDGIPKIRKKENEQIAKAKNEGHDGIIFTIGEGNAPLNYVAFHPTQIKSIFNTGTWDPTNPDIRFSLAGRKAKGAELTPDKDRGKSQPMTTEGEGRIPTVSPKEAEGGEEWARKAYEDFVDASKEVGFEVPEGWYVHGRKDRSDLETDWHTLLTRRWDIAEEYSGTPMGEDYGPESKGSIWLIRPKKDAVVFDLSSETTADMDKVVEKAIEDFESDNLPNEIVSDIESQLYPERDIEEKDIDWAIRQVFAPKDIVTSADGFESGNWLDWFYDTFEPDFIETPDGAVWFKNEDAVDMVMVPKSLPKPSRSPLEGEQLHFSMGGPTQFGKLMKLIEEEAKTVKPPPNWNTKSDLPDFISEKFGKTEKTPGQKLKEALQSIKEKDWWDRLATLSIDRLRPIKTKVSEEAYRLHRLATGSQAAVAMFLRHGKLSWDPSGLMRVDTRNKGFMEFLKGLGKDYHKFLYWVAARRAERLETEGRERWLDKDARDKIFGWSGGRENQKWEKAANKLQDFNDSVLDLAQEAGLINERSRDRWSREFYVPFYRVFEDEQERHDFLTRPDKISSQIKRLVGGEEKIGDPLENLLKNWTHLINESMRNKARREAFEFASLSKSGLVDIVDKKALNIYRNSKDKKMVYITNNKDNVLMFQNDGKPVYFKVNDPALFQAMSDLNTHMFDNFLMKLMGKTKKALTYGATFGPGFRIANMLRDTLHTSMVAKSFKPFLDTGKGLVKAWREDPQYIAFMASGAGFGSSYVRADDPKAVTNYINRIIKKEGKDAKDRILNTPKKMLDFWEKVGSVSENAARVQLYSNLLKEGKTHAEAAFEARDLLDFTMRGEANIVNFLIQTIPFLNARMQGLYKLGRVAASPETRRTFALRGSLLMAASLALWAIHKDDEEYQELEDWDKWGYYHFWIGDKHFRIPKPFEVGALFSSFPEAMANVLNGSEKTKHIGNMLGYTAKETFAVSFPQLITPMLEQWANKSSYTGRPIVGQALQRLKPGEQADPWTSETMQLAGKLGISPKRAEALVQGYFATFGMFLLGISDIAVRNIFDFPEKATQRIDDYPAIGRFVKSRGPARYTKYQSWFYETFDEIDRTVRTIKHYQATGDMDKARDLYSESKNKIRFKKPFGVIRRSLTDLNRKVKAVMRSDMEPDKKRDLLDRLSKRRNRLVKVAWGMFHRAGGD